MANSEADKIKEMKIASAKKILEAYQKKGRKKDRDVDGPNNISPIDQNIHFEKVDAEYVQSNRTSHLIDHTEVNDRKEYQESIIPQNGSRHQNGKNENFNIQANSIEILINEKTTLSASLTQCQADLKERDFEVEELSGRLKENQKRVTEMEKSIFEMQKQMTNLVSERTTIEVLLKKESGKMAVVEKSLEDQKERIEELKTELCGERLKREKLEQEIKEKDCELKLNQIRMCEIADQNSVKADDRIESLTQAKFVHEQQIHDLQAMVQQLEAERDQSNQQYQNYVQQLNKKIKQLSTKNEEMIDENAKQAQRETSLISHINSLEKQLQQTLVQREASETRLAIKEMNNMNVVDTVDYENILKENDNLLEQINVFKKRIASLEEANNEKDIKLVELESNVNSLAANRPSDSQLLARIENEKVAASIAVSQNEELKKQLKEIEGKLIVLTNDKVDLVNILHSEQHTNREIRLKFVQLEEDLRDVTAKLHFKDEEMIRLTHENSELRKNIEDLKQQISSIHIEDTCISNMVQTSEVLQNHSEECSMIPHEADETNINPSISENAEKGLKLPTPDAMKKLEERFKSLMNDVANLTDEKQRLEHLVLQLQGETETIGEYITLYQMQRKLLKQREIEKDVQLSNLLAQREQMQNKLVQINQLVHRLFQSSRQNQPTNGLHNSKEISGSVDSLEKENFIVKQSEELIVKINTLIDELEETRNLNSVIAIDHCACCSGKFETV